MLGFRWRYRLGVSVTPEKGGIRLASPDRETVLLPLPPDLAQAIVGLDGDLSDDSVARAAGSDIGMAARLFRLRSRLHQHLLLAIELHHGDRRLAQMLPHTSFDPAALLAGRARDPKPRTLSRFAFLHREGERFVLECPEAPCNLVLEDPELVGWLLDAAAGATPEPDSLRAEVMTLLEALGFVDSSEAEEPPARRTWEFHDRLFHRRSRSYPDFRPYGGTYRFGGRPGDDRATAPGPPPAIRPPHAGDTIDLPTPDGTGSQALLDVMENRRSRREMAAAPVTLSQVAALLYRVGRVTGRLPHDLLMRPYPAGGAIHELELYLAVGKCDGLAAGFHHYRSDIHALTHLSGDDPDRAASAMLADCQLAWGSPDEPPQCLVVISSRLPRLAWKYEALAYRLSLMNAGVVLQSLHLVAEDIGLNGSAAGSGNPELFALATGEPSWEETSIAEFGFGSRPTAS